MVFGLDGVVPGGFSHGFGLSSGGDPSCCLGEAVDGEEGEPEDEHLVCLVLLGLEMREVLALVWAQHLNLSF